MKHDLINDINRCMQNINIIDTRMATARFIFNEDFLGFKGHFENNPVLPGVCKILAAIEIIKKWKGNEYLELKDINSAKFFMPVMCNEELIFNCLDNESSESLLIKIKITKGKEKVSELKLKF